MNMRKMIDIVEGEVIPFPITPKKAEPDLNLAWEQGKNFASEKTEKILTDFPFAAMCFENLSTENLDISTTNRNKRQDCLNWSLTPGEWAFELGVAYYFKSNPITYDSYDDI